jgi:hypothetical protein
MRSSTAWIKLAEKYQKENIYFKNLIIEKWQKLILAEKSKK